MVHKSLANGTSCYLYASPDDIDHEYTYVIWTGDGNDNMDELL